MYEDHKSVAIEVAYSKWTASGKIKDPNDAKLLAENYRYHMVSPDYYIDFSKNL